ncbi:hypothetical protein E2562_003068 [Oryza meyeriana var. granulata]|uniref:DUF6598 domain-containing protein n=1 Tax=Oryza meyeriana var. granulata TaxID=110450 RepID=A0A6G1E958_9ORYZ|nr:hypothetical protein E2562_003068 [Oryza meyeriana var. granulata]KAF0921258.1 hypothetical protein E2562_003068 [Oryza meyeriana var. granulata]
MDRDADIVHDVTNHDHSKFIKDIRALHTRRPCCEFVKGKPMLPRQSDGQPMRWNHIKLYVRIKGQQNGGEMDSGKNKEETRTITLAVRDDNLYCWGFKNQKGKWFTFTDPPPKNMEAQTTQEEHEVRCRGLPPEYKATKLWCTEDYKSILGVKHKKDFLDVLLNAKLDKDFMIAAVDRLSRYKDPNYDADQQGTVSSKENDENVDKGNGLPLVGLIIMVCESARLSSIYDTVVEGVNGNKLTKEQIYCMWKWKPISDALRDWDETEQWVDFSKDGKPRHLKSVGIKDQYGALKQAEVLLNKSLHEHPDHMYVEPFAVRANFKVVPGTTITFQDWKSKQIYIYKLEQGDHGPIHDFKGNLVLTGPDRAISAYGKFTIKVDIPRGDNGPIEEFVFEWDPYKYAAEVDKRKVMSRTIWMGPDHNMEITYAVWSNARQAIVQVDLLPIEGICLCAVHGEITVHIHDLKIASVLLPNTGLPLHSGSSSTLCFHLQLARSVLAVPSCWPIEVHVSLHAIIDDGKLVEKAFDGTVPFYGQTSRQFKTLLGAVEVKITWDPELTVPRLLFGKLSEKDLHHVVYNVLESDRASFFKDLGDMLQRYTASFVKDVCDMLQKYATVHDSLWLRRPFILPEIKKKREELACFKLVNENKATTALAIRFSDMSLVAFMNHNGDWYELRGPRMLPAENEQSKLICRPASYASLLFSGMPVHGLMRRLDLGMETVAMAEAVSMLSHFVPSEDGHMDEGTIRALASLLHMVCETVTTAAELYVDTALKEEAVAIARSCAHAAIRWCLLSSFRPSDLRLWRNRLCHG